MKPEPRTLPEIARSHDAIASRHGQLHAAALAGSANRADLVELARLETELRAFEAMSMRHAPHCLMATGLLWGDEMRHPAAPGVAARVRLSDIVEVEGAEMTIAAATRIVAASAKKGVAIADWSGAGVRLGDALLLEHPPRTAAEPPAAGSNYQLL